MTNRPDHFDQAGSAGGGDPDPQELASLLRAAADDELTAEQSERLQRAIEARPELAERIEFEKELRRRVGVAMNEPRRAPEHLRNTVQRTLRAEPMGGEEESEPATVGPAPTWKRAFWSRRWTWAAAAVAVLTAGVVLMQTPWLSLRGGPTIAINGEPRFVGLVSYVAGEHERCSSFGEYFQEKFQARRLDQAREEAANILDQSPERISLNTTGYRLAGLGRCNVPGAGASVHALYRPGDQGRSTLSLFVQREWAGLGLESGVCYQVTSETKPPVLVWKHEGLVYYLFSPDAEARRQVGRALGAPQREVVL